MPTIHRRMAGAAHGANKEEAVTEGIVPAQNEQLQRGREALQRHAWEEAFEALAGAAAIGPAPAEDLEALAEAAHWTAHFDAELGALEAAYGAYIDADNHCRAAHVALQLATAHDDKGAEAVASGWRSRAERLLEQVPECAVHGYLATHQWWSVFWGHLDFEHAQRLAERAAALGDEYGDRDLWALATHGVGWSLLMQGSIDRGLALIDESAAAAVGGEVSLRAAGDIYCWTIDACRSVGDYKRAADWTEAMRRWCDRQSVTGFPGVCRVHRAQIFALHGAFQHAEVEAEQACQELATYIPQRVGEAYAELVWIRLRMGDLADAEQAFDEACRLGLDPIFERALLRLVRGNASSAAATIRRIASEAWHPNQRARVLPTWVAAALAAGQVEEASRGAEQLEAMAHEYGTAFFTAQACQARGAVQLAQGQAEEALTSLRRAVRLWQEIDAPYESAQVRILLSQAHRALGEHEDAMEELRTAQSLFERLGAARDARHATEELTRSTHAPRDAGSARTTRAFLFSDLVGSTNLVEVIGDEAWEALLAWHDRTLRSLFAEHHGQEVDHAGDGFFVAFEDAARALNCAIAIQRGLAEHRRTHGFSPGVRIGVHLAEAIDTGGSYKGKGVHEAARIAALAQGGEILTSRETLAAAGNSFTASAPRPVSLKGISLPIDVCTVAWR